MAPQVPPRLQLQLDHLQDMIKEQDRMVLAEVEPTDSDRVDMMELLASIQHQIENGGAALISHLRGLYEQRCASLTELGYNVAPYSLSIPSPPPSSSKNILFSPTNSGSSRSSSPPPRPSSIRSSRKASKRVHFARDLPETLDSLPEAIQYHDDPGDLSSVSSAQLFDGNQLLIEDQDRRLEQIGGSINRQRALGEHINDELDVHNQSLSDLESQVDASDSRLNRLTNGVRVFNRQSRECGVCTIIFGLVLVLLIVLVI